MTRTPDEIKKGLECCARVGHCYECPYKEECLHSVDDATPMHMDALAYIQQLEAELSDAKNNHQHTIDIAERQKSQIDKLKKVVVRLNTERDAAVDDLKKAANATGKCFGCKWYNGKICTSKDYKPICSSHDDKWEWRGVQKEE